MKILHAYCLNYNIGDYYLGIGVKNLLRHYLNVDFVAEINIQGTIFNEYFIREVVNSNYDLLVIGGGGLIHGAHWPHGWFWLIEKKLISLISIPFIVYGVGYNYFDNEGGIPDRGKSHLLVTIKNAAYFSLRNDGSLGRFQGQMGISVPEIPDPGFHVALNKQYSCKKKKPFVLVQVANDKPEYRFGSKENREKFISEMRFVTSYLSRRYKVIFCPHVFHDIEISEKIAQGIPNSEIWDFSTFAFDNCVASLGYYQEAEFVLSMRGHGQIIPIAFNTPVIALVNHPKHSGLMNKIGLDAYNVSVRSKNLGQILINRIDRIIAEKKNYILNLQDVNRFLASASKKAWHDIRVLIG